MKIKRLIIFITILVLLFTPYLANAQQLNIPDSKKALEEAYRDMFEIAKEYETLYEQERADRIEIQQEKNKWKELYQGAELNVERLLTSIEKWKELYYTEREMVMELMKRKNMSVSTGVGYNIKNPDESLALLQFNFGF